MRRISVLVSVAAVVLLGVLAVGRSVGTAAQDAAPGPAAGHPLVGSWLLDTDADDPGNPPSVAAVGADGTYVEVDVDGAAVGAWEATGERTASLTLVFPIPDGQGGFAGTGKVRGSIEVDAAGDTLTATATFELVGPDGASQGEFGPIRVTGERIVVEPMGTPVGPIEDLFGPPEVGTPEAGTPAP